MREIPYNRYATVDYARRWALKRNPIYYNFENIGGDCTNFASQCIYAGAKVMNYTKVLGWYYNSANDRSPSWSSAMYLHDFLVNNRSVGPYGHTVSQSEIVIGDIVQLGRIDGSFYHSLVITDTAPEILVTAHSFDAVDVPLSSYSFAKDRFIHIDGARAW